MVSKVYADIGGGGNKLTYRRGRKMHWRDNEVRELGFSQREYAGSGCGPWPSSFRKLNRSKNGSMGNGGGEGRTLSNLRVSRTKPECQKPELGSP